MMSVPLESDGRRNKLKAPVRTELKTRSFPWGRNQAGSNSAALSSVTRRRFPPRSIHHPDVDAASRGLPDIATLRSSGLRLNSCSRRLADGSNAIAGSVHPDQPRLETPVFLIQEDIRLGH